MKHLRYLTFLLLCLPLISLAQTYNFAQGKVTLAPYEKGLALDFELIKDWHIYWINSGDSGAPPIWYFEFQDNNTIAQEHWPLPKRIPANSLITFGYEERALFLFELGKKNIPFSGELKLEFLICKEECIPYINELSFSFSPEEQKESYINKLQSSFIYPSRSKESVIFYGNKGGEFQFELPSLPTNLELQHVFPFNGELFTTAPHQSLSTQKFALQALNDSKVLSNSEKLLLVFRDKNTNQITAQITQITQPPPPLLMILMLAFLGGLILNIMPCVFPVLSFKALSLLENAQETKKLRSSGIFYSLGVTSVFLLLGGLIAILRAQGDLLGWGFQLQYPATLAILATLFFWIGASFIGFIDLDFYTPQFLQQQSKNEAVNSFFTGILATVVATPCSAPFMGTALGASLLLPWQTTLLIYLFLAIGMSFPFLLLSFVPQLGKLLPRPGPWMEQFKKILSLPMFLTALWLLWILNFKIELYASLFILILFLALGLVLVRTKQLKADLKKKTLLIMILISLLAPLFVAQVLPKNLQDAVTEADTQWQNFSPQIISDLLAQEQSVFIDFTAAWCITCQVNKKMVLNTDEALAFFKDQKITLVRADWTDKNSEIANYLALYNRTSLPFYLYFHKGKKEPIILPEILSMNILKEKLTPKEEQP